MTKIKMCGLTRTEDINFANELKPDYIGFVFAKNSKRYITPQKALILREQLSKEIMAAGVFVNEDPGEIAAIIKKGAVDVIQLHGTEDNDYISILRSMTDCMIIKAFRIRSQEDIISAENSIADMVLLDAGAGDGQTFDWSLIGNVERPYFLAGGLCVQNVGQAVSMLHPFGVDVSSGIETDGFKDKRKMADFISAVRKEDSK